MLLSPCRLIYLLLLADGGKIQVEGESDTLACVMQQIRGWIVGNEGIGGTEKAEEIKVGRYKHKERRNVKKWKKKEENKGKGVR